MKKYSKNSIQVLSDKLVSRRYSYFPGCSLAASGHENNQSIYKFCNRINIELQELDDWNCCGSSSAHSIDAKAAALLPQRNLMLAPKGIPLLVACPSCYMRLRSTHLLIKSDSKKQDEYSRFWQRDFDPDLEIIHFFDIFSLAPFEAFVDKNAKLLNGIRFAPYYGCMLAKPPALKRDKSHYGILEKTLSKLNADAVSWPHFSKCCGTFLSVAKPGAATIVVNKIVQAAIDSGAECLVTACAMCHLNLEIRCTLKKQIPTFHFSELLSLALGVDDHEKWFPRHIVDPSTLLKKRGLI